MIKKTSKLVLKRIDISSGEKSFKSYKLDFRLKHSEIKAVSVTGLYNTLIKKKYKHDHFLSMLAKLGAVNINCWCTTLLHRTGMVGGQRP